MKYIDADRLRAEIERRIYEINHPLKDGYEVQSIGKIEGLSELLEVIDSLQQEQPEVDLEKEIDTFFEGWTDSPDYSQAINAEGECVSTDEIIEIARQFFNLGLNARREE